MALYQFFNLFEDWLIDFNFNKVDNFNLFKISSIIQDIIFPKHKKEMNLICDLFTLIDKKFNQIPKKDNIA